MADKKFRIFGGIGCGLLVALLAAAAFVLNRRKKQRLGSVAIPPAIEGAMGADKSLAGLSAEEELGLAGAAKGALPSRQGEELLNTLSLPEVPAQQAEGLVKRLQKEAKKDPVAAAQLIRSWLTAPE